MPYFFDRWYTPTTPISVKGGIKTNSKRGVLATNWWGQKWIKVLESFNIESRLARGRSYARRGQVINLSINKGLVTAEVQGSTFDPYEVFIKLRCYDESQWQKVIAGLADKPLYCAQLINGRMPDDIEAMFTSLELNLFPVKEDDLESDCSCPDWANPCKHIAAVYYLLAEAFDKDPFLLFELRGMKQSEIMEKLQSLDIDQTVNYVELPDEPLPVREDQFWGKEIENLDLPIENLKVHAALPKRLGKISFWRSDTDLMAYMEQVYSTVSEKTIKLRERFIEATEDGL